MRCVILLMAVSILTAADVRAESFQHLLEEKRIVHSGAESARAQPPLANLYWDRGPTFEFPEAGAWMRLNSLLQSRYTLTDNNRSADGANRSSFDLRRARITASGAALKEQFAYQLSAEFVGLRGADGAATAALRDAYIEWRTAAWLSLRLGQFKTNLSRQFMNSASTLQFVDRSVVNDYFFLNRQGGALASFNFLGGRLEGGAGIFNGESDGESGPNYPSLDTKHTRIVSARYAVLGTMNPYAEGDLEWSEEPAISLGGSYAFADSNNTVAGFASTAQQQILASDLNIKCRGFSLHAELYRDSYEVDAAAGDSTPRGFYTQAGYFVIPSILELAGRYGRVNCDSGTGRGRCAGNDNISEISAGLNYFFFGHNLKAQLNYSHISEDVASGAEPISSDRWILQLQSFL